MKRQGHAVSDSIKRQEITALQVDSATTKANLDNLANDVSSLTIALKDNTEMVAALKQTIDQSRGALYVIGAGSGVVGALASWFATSLWGKHS
jgi:hypothetical protein